MRGSAQCVLPDDVRWWRCQWGRGGSEWRNNVFDVCRQNPGDEDQQTIFIIHEREQESLASPLEAQFLSCLCRMQVKSLVTCWTVGRPLWWEEGESEREDIQRRSAVGAGAGVGEPSPLYLALSSLYLKQWFCNCGSWPLCGDQRILSSDTLHVRYLHDS